MVIRGETRQQTAPSSLAQLPWGNEDRLAIGCFVCGLITLSLSNEFFSLSMLENIVRCSLRRLCSILPQIRRVRREPRTGQVRVAQRVCIHLRPMFL